jgi:uncharacterized protein
MQATVAMTGSGGWPMSVFLTPELKPFYTGTYFPPVPRYNMLSFRDLLAGIARTWQEQQGEALSVSAPADSNFTEAHLAAAENPCSMPMIGAMVARALRQSLRMPVHQRS